MDYVINCRPARFTDKDGKIIDYTEYYISTSSGIEIPIKAVYKSDRRLLKAIAIERL